MDLRLMYQDILLRGEKEERRARSESTPTINLTL
jgi:hypothetical protein